MNKESESKLRAAKNKDELIAILSGDELRLSEGEIDELWQRRQALSEAENMTALDDDELNAVSGGALWFGDDAEDGHEIGCIWYWHWKNECEKSPEQGGYHYTCEGTDTDPYKFCHTYYYCSYCGKRMNGLI